MHQRCGLQCVALPLVLEITRSLPPQLVIDDGHQIVERLTLAAVAPLAKHLGNGVALRRHLF